MGGLGNQMNQYAIARKLSILLGVDFKLDTETTKYYKKDFMHTYQLNNFNVMENIATSKDISKFIKKGKGFYKLLNQARRAMGLKVDKNIIYKSNCYIEPQPPTFNDEVLALSDNSYLWGYFASFKYFDDIRDVLLEDFSLKNPLSDESAAALEKIQNSNSVSIHFRRGDFLSNAEVRSQVEGINTDEYYLNAIEYAASKVKDPHFFIFSDEIDYLKENLKIEHPVTYVDFNPPQRGFEDMYLMSNCKCNILAGISSFSYWAAYLNDCLGKIVIIPSNAYNDDFYPYEVIKIPSVAKAII